MFMQMPIFVKLIKKMKIKWKFVSPTAYHDVRSSIVSIIGKFVRHCISGTFIKFISGKIIKIHSLVIVNKIVTISDDVEKILVSSKSIWLVWRSSCIHKRKSRTAKKSQEERRKIRNWPLGVERNYRAW